MRLELRCHMGRESGAMGLTLCPARCQSVYNVSQDKSRKACVRCSGHRILLCGWSMVRGALVCCVNSSRRTTIGRGDYCPWLRDITKSMTQEKLCMVKETMHKRGVKLCLVENKGFWRRQEQWQREASQNSSRRNTELVLAWWKFHVLWAGVSEETDFDVVESVQQECEEWRLFYLIYTYAEEQWRLSTACPRGRCGPNPVLESVENSTGSTSSKENGEQCSEIHGMLPMPSGITNAREQTV